MLNKNKIYKFYNDSGHGWLAVKFTELEALNLTGLISSYSYIKGNTVYLEEDCDASRFFKAFEVKFGIPPRYMNKFHNDGPSPIRSYNRFTGVK